MAKTLARRERQFFGLFREHAANLVEAIRVLNELLQRDSDDFSSEARKLRDLEHQGDEITHRIIRQLDSTFVTPFDRQDIYALAAALDDIVDLTEEIADTIVIDRINQITAEARQMGEILIQIGQELADAIDALDARKSLTKHWVAIHDLENQGDRVTRRAIGSLFEDDLDPVVIIKWKDVYALLEKTVDRTEDVANILESVAIRNP